MVGIKDNISKKAFEEILKENKYYKNWKLLCPIKIVKISSKTALLTNEKQFGKVLNFSQS